MNLSKLMVILSGHFSLSFFFFAKLFVTKCANRHSILDCYCYIKYSLIIEHKILGIVQRYYLRLSTKLFFPFPYASVKENDYLNISPLTAPLRCWSYGGCFHGYWLQVIIITEKLSLILILIILILIILINVISTRHER